MVNDNGEDAHTSNYDKDSTKSYTKYRNPARWERGGTEGAGVRGRGGGGQGGVALWRAEAFSDGERDHDYCRNPGASQSSAWCYTSWDGSYERCDVSDACEC